MHDQHIAHRDLKPENILLKGDSIKIGDFGSSKLIEPGSEDNTPYVVSRYYRAPEVILASTKYDCSLDIWAVGCIIFELFTKEPLFLGENEGLQLGEFTHILGFPSKSQLSLLEKYMTP